MEQKQLVIDPLVVRCKNGDRSALQQLYEQYSRAMYNICLRMLNNVQDAEDTLQEAFYQVFRNIGGYRGEATIGAWIKSIVVHKCLNHLKKKTPVLVEANDLEFVEEERVDEEKYAYTVKNVKRAISALPDGYRVVISLYLFENYSHRQIAEKLGISESTAKTQYMRAKQKVRESVAWYDQ